MSGVDLTVGRLRQRQRSHTDLAMLTFSAPFLPPLLVRFDRRWPSRLAKLPNGAE